MTPEGYPDEAELETIAKWPHEKGWTKLMDFVRQRWAGAGAGIRKEKGKVDRYEISTGGWSGNESLISAMRRNLVFWSLFWVQERRGGHFIFEVRR